MSNAIPICCTISVKETPFPSTINQAAGSDTRLRVSKALLTALPVASDNLGEQLGSGLDAHHAQRAIIREFSKVNQLDLGFGAQSYGNHIGIAVDKHHVVALMRALDAAREKFSYVVIGVRQQYPPMFP